MQEMGSAMTKEEFRALIEKVMDEMVAEGIFRVVGIDYLGRKRYVRIAAVNGRHSTASPPKTKQ